MAENHEENMAVTKSEYETTKEFIARKEKVEKQTTLCFVTGKEQRPNNILVQV